MTATDKLATSAPVNVPTAGQKRVVIVGASGMVGGYALRYALDSPAVKSVTSIGRKKLGISEPKLKEVVHQDFANCSSLADLLSEQDAAVYCLGTYTGSVSDAELRTITAGYPLKLSLGNEQVPRISSRIGDRVIRLVSNIYKPSRASLPNLLVR